MHALSYVVQFDAFGKKFRRLRPGQRFRTLTGLFKEEPANQREQTRSCDAPLFSPTEGRTG